MGIEPFVFELSNGMRLVHMPVTRPVTHAGLLINMGSRDENDSEHGLAHYIEHCLFKGTRKRKTYHILNRLDSVGGELNAFTAKEETWIYASFIHSHADRAIELISDIAFGSTFPANEINKEREVIADEIRSYLDSPSEMLFEEFDAMIYDGHALGRNIIGTEESLASFRQHHLRDFILRRKTRKNYVLSVVSNLDSKTLVTLAEKHFGHHRFVSRSASRRKFSNYHPKHRIQKKDVHQTQWISGCEAYSYMDDRRIGLSLLNNLLGGPSMNNRLSLSLREKHGLTYNVESNYFPMSDTGTFYVYLGVDKENLDKCRDLLGRELKLLMKKKLGHSQLFSLKKQVKGQIALSQDNGPAVMFALGKSLQLYDRIEPLDKVFQQIDAISASELLEIANEIFDQKQWSSLTYHN